MLDTQGEEDCLPCLQYNPLCESALPGECAQPIERTRSDQTERKEWPNTVQEDSPLSRPGSSAFSASYPGTTIRQKLSLLHIDHHAFHRDRSLSLKLISFWNHDPLAKLIPFWKRLGLDSFDQGVYFSFSTFFSCPFSNFRHVAQGWSATLTR